MDMPADKSKFIEDLFNTEVDEVCKVCKGEFQFKDSPHARYDIYIPGFIDTFMFAIDSSNPLHPLTASAPIKPHSELGKSVRLGLETYMLIKESE